MNTLDEYSPEIVPEKIIYNTLFYNIFLTLYSTLLKYYVSMSNILPMNAKRHKFIELANNRVNRAIKDLRLIGNLSNRSAYEYSEQDVKQIIQVLQRETESIRARFGRPGEAADSEFRIKD